MISDRLAQGLAAVGGQAGSEHRATQRRDESPRSVPRHQPPHPERWEDRVTRATFHIDRDLLRALDHAAANSGQSKSNIVRDGLRRELERMASGVEP